MSEHKTQYKTRDVRITFTFFSGILALLAYKHSVIKPQSITNTFSTTHNLSILSYLFIMLAAILLFLVIYSPSRLTQPFKLWMKAAQFLGTVNTKLLLMLLFVLIFVPAGLLRRLYGKDPMQRRLRCGESYWEPYELAGLKDKNRYEKQF